MKKRHYLKLLALFVVSSHAYSSKWEATQLLTNDDIHRADDEVLAQNTVARLVTAIIANDNATLDDIIAHNIALNINGRSSSGEGLAQMAASWMQQNRIRAANAIRVFSWILAQQRKLGLALNHWASTDHNGNSLGRIIHGMQGANTIINWFKENELLVVSKQYRQEILYRKLGRKDSDNSGSDKKNNSCIIL